MLFLPSFLVQEPKSKPPSSSWISFLSFLPIPLPFLFFQPPSFPVLQPFSSLLFLSPVSFSLALSFASPSLLVLSFFAPLAP